MSSTRHWARSCRQAPSSALGECGALSREDGRPSVRGSPGKAERTFQKAYNSALETYGGDEERARRTAFAALKHSFEKVGDHWEPKDEKGPSDPRAARGGDEPGGDTAGGVDVAGHTRDELDARARELGIKGRSNMDKMQLARRIAQKQD